jgi:Asp-tRNA(Asn)/Glu-tRNA(Gln) amidotransferase A subunit family amidase
MTAANRGAPTGIAEGWLGLATAEFGADRAAELEGPLRERAEQISRVHAALVDGDDGVGPVESGIPMPSVESCATAAELIKTIRRLDPELSAWAWTALPARDNDDSLPRSSGTLDGWAVGVKDVIDVAGMPTRCGSALTPPAPAASDAPVVTRLRAAGAAILGKTRCTEWALNDPGPTRNPWSTDRTPGGSSSGSAVAVATRMCVATVDTQTAGDVLRPAAYNGVVGFKPTFGWTPTDGTHRVAPTIDTIGVMGARVDDVATIATAVANDPGAFSGSGSAASPRLAVADDPFFTPVNPTMKSHLDVVVQHWSEAGARVSRLSSPVDLSLLHAAHRVICFAECAVEHALRYPAQRGGYGPRARELLDLGRITPAWSYLAAQGVRRRLARHLERVFEHLDVLVVPVTPEPAPTGETTGDSRWQIPWTLCGFPVLALPAGLTSGLPIAVQLVGGPYRDADLLATGRWCEAVLGERCGHPAT